MSFISCSRRDRACIENAPFMIFTASAFYISSLSSMIFSIICVILLCFIENFRPFGLFQSTLYYFLSDFQVRAYH